MSPITSRQAASIFLIWLENMFLNIVLEPGKTACDFVFYWTFFSKCFNVYVCVYICFTENIKNRTWELFQLFAINSAWAALWQKC